MTCRMSVDKLQPHRLNEVSTSGFPERGHADDMDERTRVEMERLVREALAEDVGDGDVTTLATVPEALQAEGEIAAREELVVSGVAVVERVFAVLCPTLVCERRVDDGARVKPGEVIMVLRGSAAPILTGERVALNLLQRLSGVASLTRQYVDGVAGTGVQILDTRKTTPGMRWLEKQAVFHGGGVNHRAGLFDAVLIKDNHLAALAGRGSNAIGIAVERARERWPGLIVEVEADTLDQAKAAVAAGVDVVLLDNMSLDTMRSAVQWIDGRATTEASGGVLLETVRAIAETGVDRISVGALTHSARAVDLALDLRVATEARENGWVHGAHHEP